MRSGFGVILRYPSLVCTKLRARLASGMSLSMRNGLLASAIPCVGSGADSGAASCALQTGSAGMLCYAPSWRFADDGELGTCADPLRPAARSGHGELAPRLQLLLN